MLYFRQVSFSNFQFSKQLRLLKLEHHYYYQNIVEWKCQIFCYSIQNMHKIGEIPMQIPKTLQFIQNHCAHVKYANNQCCLLNAKWKKLIYTLYLLEICNCKCDDWNDKHQYGHTNDVYTNFMVMLYKFTYSCIRYILAPIGYICEL